jgi:hypothetical protein
VHAERRGVRVAVVARGLLGMAATSFGSRRGGLELRSVAAMERGISAEVAGGRR